MWQIQTLWVTNSRTTSQVQPATLWGQGAGPVIPVTANPPVTSVQTEPVSASIRTRWETAKAPFGAERRTPSPRVLDLAPVEPQTGEAFRPLGIALATLKGALLLFTAHWVHHNRGLTLHPLPAPDCPIRSQSGISCSEPELTAWLGSAVRSQRTRRCEETGGDNGRMKERTADRWVDTVAGRKGDATRRSHGSTEREEEGRSWPEEFRGHCRLRRCWSWATWSRTGWGTANCSMIGQQWRSSWLMGPAWRVTVSSVPALCYRLLLSDCSQTIRPPVTETSSLPHRSRFTQGWCG